MNVNVFDSNDCKVVADTIENIERDDENYVTVYLNNDYYVVLSQSDIERLKSI